MEGLFKELYKNNRASGMSIRVASFIAALFLSFLCCLFYDFWLDEINGIVLEEGDWQGRITGEIGEEELKMIRNHAEVEQATVNQELSEGADVVVDLRFSHASKIVRHMTEILSLRGFRRMRRSIITSFCPCISSGFREMRCQG